MPASRTTVLVGAIAAVLVLVVAGVMLYGAKKKKDLESSALASAMQATAYLREAAGLGVGAPRAADALRAHSDDLERRLATLRAEDSGRNRALAEAAEVYVVDAQAILRNHSEASRAFTAWRSSRAALLAHLRNAGNRGPAWIQTALALKSRAERDNFEARTAAEALEGLLKAHGDSQARLRAVAPKVPLLGDAERRALQQSAHDAVERAENDLQALRRLPIS
ncbi:MAG TPA: hypothetical protein VFV84_01085 [Burkholderiales bacterium]|nr:hypothetical protein [Burkholderiales bacterium]